MVAVRGRKEGKIMEEQRSSRGWEKMKEINEPYAASTMESLAEIAPDLKAYTVDFIFGDVMSNPGLDLKSRELAAVAALTALGREPQLRFHIHGALNVGWTREEIVQVITQMAVYAGFPAALNGINLAREVFAERDSAAAA
jgi:4-carboxymuconolactone decarboxylase